ncbi:PleD family two-component system response regulator [Pedobacter sp. SYSU D00535]|uniref:response regulator n=1 Tax=Pedobacter sp. SYSU D00535 TaxID=2810308 RepID=UPI001A961AA2|nr:response regulator transcription factor [Pedobacter sp. SYSU D00535]
MNNTKTILICDDDEGILDLVSIILEESGFQTVRVQNSFEVFNQIAKENPDLIFLDLWMPQLPGDQVLKTIREDAAISDIPVVVMSASRDGAQIAREAGANDFLAKPFDIDELVNKANILLS